MTADFRALCVELLDCLEKADWPNRYKAVFQQWTGIARAALSDKELLEKGPSLEEVEELCEEHCFNVEGYESLECLQGLINDALARWGTPNLTETRRSLTDAWAAHQPAIEAAAKAGMDACRQQPSDHLYVHFASLEWKLGCHMAEWKAARDELNQAHCDGVVQLLREHLEGHGQA